MRRQRTRGFSLVEVLVAIAIFGLMLGGVFTSLNRSRDLVRASAGLLQARLLASTTLESMKVMSFDDLHSHSFTETTPQGRMVVDVQVSDFQSSTLKKIDVSVQWTDQRAAQSRELALSTLRSRYAL